VALALAGTGITGVSFLWKANAALEAGLEERTAETARLVARYAIVDLSFDQNRQLNETLRGFADDPDVDLVQVWDADGELFAGWERPGAPTLGSAPFPGEPLRGEGWVARRADVVHDGRPLGVVVVRAPTASNDARAAAHLRGVLVVGASALLGVLLVYLAVRRLVVEPVERFATGLNAIAGSGDYAVRLPAPAIRELTPLTDSFNSLLSAVELRQRQREMAEALQRRAVDRIRRIRHIESGIGEGLAPGAVAARAVDAVFGVTDCRCVLVVSVEGDAPAGLLAWGREGALLTDPMPAAALEEVVNLAALDGSLGPPRAAPVPGPPSDWRAALGVPTVKSLLALPLHHRGELLGGLLLGLTETRAAPRDVMHELEGIAEVLALSQQEARLRTELARYTGGLEKSVALRTAQLAASNKELESFAHTVAHDLRAPLRAMNGFATALLEDHAEKLDEVGQEYLRRIARASARMDVLIQELLQYSRLSIEDPPLEPVSLRAVLDGQLTLLDGEIARTGATVTLDVGDTRVLGHATSLGLVFGNLLTNAMKFVAPGERPCVRVGVEPRPGRVRVWVEDAGIGIAAEHHQRVFKVFERLHRDDAYAGTGMGLAIVRKATERMGGLVGVESTPGVGSRFWVELVPAE